MTTLMAAHPWLTWWAGVAWGTICTGLGAFLGVRNAVAGAVAKGLGW